jgi:hypothetical protein
MTVKKDSARGTWYFVVDLPSVAGKRQQLKRRGFKTKKEALAAERDVLADVGRSRYVRPARGTLAEYLTDTWLPSRRVNLRPSTVLGYEKIIRRRIVPVIVVISLLSLTAVDSCTSCASGQLDVNGQAMEIANVAAWTGMLIFTILALWTMILAGVIASDHLAHPLEDGSASLALARPVSRNIFALSRLTGALTIAYLTGALLLGGTAALLASRSGADPMAALWGALACAAGCFTVACLSMTTSLWLPQIATTLLVFASVGAVAITNLLGQVGTELGSITGAIEHYGPPLATSIVVALGPWIEPTGVTGNPVELAVRSLLWSAGSLALLLASFRRLEIGR